MQEEMQNTLSVLMCACHYSVYYSDIVTTTIQPTKTESNQVSHC